MARISTVTLTIAAVAIVLTACSSGSQPTATPPANTTPATTTAAAVTTPAAALWTTKEAQQHYLAIVGPLNKTAATLGSLTSASPLGTITSECATIAADEDTAARQLTAGHWPATAQSQINALVTATTQSRASFQTCAASTTAATAVNAVNTAAGTTNGPAEAVRIALGLPGN